MVTFARLQDGSWGLRGGPDLQPGQQVTVTRKDGSQRIQYVGKIVWRGDDFALAEITSADGAALICSQLAEAAARQATQERMKTDFANAPQPAGVALELFPFQRAGVAFLAPLKGAILGDEMGLGKTFQAIGWAVAELTGTEPASQKAVEPGRCKICGRRLVTKDAAAVGMGPICAKRAGQGFNYRKRPERTAGTVVVCPATMKYKWQSEILRARPADRIVVVDGKVGVPAAGEADWVVINYDLLANRKVKSDGDAMRMIKGAVDALVDFGAHNVILDESHYVKNKKSNRTKAALDLVAEIPRRLMVTGTPLLNRPVELWTQLLAAGVYPDKAFFRWAQRYCNAQQEWVGRERMITGKDGKLKRIGGMVWNFNGASHLDELHESLKPFFIRRLKQDVLPDLPPIIYTDEPVVLDNADEYRAAQDDFKEWYARKGRFAGAVEHLQQLTALRQLAVAGKVAGLIERLDAFREEGKKAIVFCGFVQEGLNKVAAALAPEEFMRITGAETAEQRQAAVDRFQTDPACLFALCSTTAAGIGITLTAADTVLFLDLPWTPGAKAQAEARAHRIGQQANVQVVHLLGRGTVDEAMANVIREKAVVIAQAVDGQVVMTDGTVAQAVSARIARGGENAE